MASTPRSLDSAWGRRPCVLPHDWLDLSPVATDLPSVERLLRTLDESRMRVRIPGDGPASGSPRRVMLSEDLDAATAAFRVGYESPSQFTREYRRLFGAPPYRDITRLGKSPPRSV